MQQYRPSGFSMLPMVVKNLLIVNGLFFLATIALESTFQIDMVKYLGLHYPLSSDFGVLAISYLHVYAWWFCSHSIQYVCSLDVW